MARLLILPSHVGLGHIARDLAMARWIRRIYPKVNITWCSAEPVTSYLKLWDERIAECSYMLRSFSEAVEAVYGSRGYSLRVMREYLGVLKTNYRVLVEHLDLDEHDLIFADEFWETLYPAPRSIRERIVFGTDFVFKPYGLGIRDNIVSFMLNRYFRKKLVEFKDLIYLNSISETPGGRWFLLLGGKVREWVREHMFVAGLATSYLPGELPGAKEARRRLSISEDSKIIAVSVGGTATRNDILLDRIIEAYRVAKDETGYRLKLLIVSGPRTKWNRRGGDDVIVFRMTRNLWNYYMAADLMIVRAGRTTTADIECLPRPLKTILIPVKNHFEQEYLAKTLAARKPWIFQRVSEDEDVESLAGSIINLLSESPSSYSRMETDERLCRGSIRAAEHISRMLREQ